MQRKINNDRSYYPASDKFQGWQEKSTREQVINDRSYYPANDKFRGWQEKSTQKQVINDRSYYPSNDKGNKTKPSSTYYSGEVRKRTQGVQALPILVISGLSLGVGALMALFWTSRSADQLRSELNHAVNAAFDYGQKTGRQTVTRLEQEIGELREKAGAYLSK